MNYTYESDGRIYTIRIDKEGDIIRATVDQGESREVRIVGADHGIIELEIAGVRRRMHVARSGPTRFVACGSDVYSLHAVERGAARPKNKVPGGGTGSGLEAAMPGQVISVAVHDGDEVTKGQTLVILEAMKMEMRVQAPFTGRVQRVLVKTGQVVERGQLLVEMSGS